MIEAYLCGSVPVQKPLLGVLVVSVLCSQCGDFAPVTGRIEGARQWCSGRCHNSADMPRQPPSPGEALEPAKALREQVDSYCSRGMEVLGGVFWK